MIPEIVTNVIGALLIIVITGLWRTFSQARKEDKIRRALRDKELKEQRDADIKFRKDMENRVSRIEVALMGDSGDPDMHIPAALGALGAIDKLAQDLRAIKTEVQTNSGKSLKDVVLEIKKKVDEG